MTKCDPQVKVGKCTINQGINLDINSIFDSFHVLNRLWLLKVIPWSFDFMEKSMKYFNTQMGIKISHVENYSIYVGYNTTLWLAGATALIGPYA